jgi:hypothetical protein
MSRHSGYMTTVTARKSDIGVKNKGVARALRAERHQEALTRNLRYYKRKTDPPRDIDYRPSGEHLMYISK